MDYNKPQQFHHVDKPYCDEKNQKDTTRETYNLNEPHDNTSMYMFYGGIALFIIYMMRKK